MQNKLELRIDIEDNDVLRSVFETISVEAQGTDSARGNVKISTDDVSLIVNIDASDLVALRALSNSIMRLVKTSLEIAELS